MTAIVTADPGLGPSSPPDEMPRPGAPRLGEFPRSVNRNRGGNRQSRCAVSTPVGSDHCRGGNDQIVIPARLGRAFTDGLQSRLRSGFRDEVSQLARIALDVVELFAAVAVNNVTYSPVTSDRTQTGKDGVDACIRCVSKQP